MAEKALYVAYDLLEGLQLLLEAFHSASCRSPAPGRRRTIRRGPAQRGQTRISIANTAVVIDSVFAWPGLGLYAFRSATSLDFPRSWASGS